MRPVHVSRSPGWILVLAALAWPVAAWCADDAPPVHFDDVTWQPATAADMAVMEPYIGTFRGKSQKADDGTEYFFAITYAWHNPQHTAVRFAIEVRIPSKGQARPLGEGFYWYDAFAERIGVSGFFKDGRIGSGYLTPFDTTSHARTVRIHARQPDGSVAEIRDTFWPIDPASWGNRTFVAMGDQGWQMVSDEVFTRLED